MQSNSHFHEHKLRQQPADEWKLEQGLEPARLMLRNQSNVKINTESPEIAKSNSSELRAGKSDDEPEIIVEEERKGWKGYVEWEDYPEKKSNARQRFAQFKFPPPPEFQLEPLPETNPVLEGIRWKMWHRAIGGALANVPEESWKTVLKGGETSRNASPPRISNEDLFPRSSTLITIQCSGTRRIEQIVEYPGEGDEMINAPWAEGAIGTAKWTGVSLKKVIKYCGGLKEGGKHLELYGAETYFKGGECMNYVVSVPWSKVKANEVLLAWEMNEKPLPKIHGFPLRVVVMGYIGARSVKWLYRVKAIETPSRAPVQSREYLYFQQQAGKHNQLPTMGIQIQEMPVSSAIMTPWNKEVVVHNGQIEVSGWAYSGGGRWPERVEISADGGYVWYPIPLENLSAKHKFAWRTWSGSVPCDHEGWTELVVRCWDNSLNTQPMAVRHSWNWGLHVTSSCHRVKIYSVNASKYATRRRLEQFEERGESFMPITRPTEFLPMTMENYEKSWLAMEPRDVDD
ncbi:hypothetical protein G7Z17_g1071 [Cylindrodendrum hubeiense]|uniref:Sulfite oxidase n=1 Tax=Cylindrodendrum hubeiense TaxID=595255 RepID=A0A9P5HFM0_9HYPO|nr:hypothetical protein G7Z17_g1071 [Cylindrodendrum hubeiense]